MKQKKRTKMALIVIPGILVISAIIPILYRAYKQREIRTDTAISTPNGIESLEKIQLGGVDQWILIRGEDQSKPVLLWLHGGPGSPTMPMASQYDQELVKHFVVVHWDQRGAGKSYSANIPESSMTIDQFVEDTFRLSQILSERFTRQKIFLLGHSWGTQVGVLTVSRHPEMYHACIAIGQFVHSPAADALSYQFAIEQAQARDDQKALGQLDAIGPPPFTTPKGRSVLAKWVDRFGGTGRNFSTFDFFRDLFISPNYALGDIFRYIRGMQFSGKSMLANGDYYRVNLFNESLKMDVPIYFFQGRYDYSTPGAVASRYYEMLEAPEKAFIWFENSAHFPQWEEPGKFAIELIKLTRHSAR